jgi:hypothetical protein
MGSLPNELLDGSGRRGLAFATPSVLLAALAADLVPGPGGGWPPSFDPEAFAGIAASILRGGRFAPPVGDRRKAVTRGPGRRGRG